MAKAKHKRSSRAPRKRRRAKRKPRPVEIALGGLAHDIRTPLTGILALSQLLHASDLPERERRWAEAIQGAADHLARLTTIVVDAARAESAGLVLRNEPFSARKLADAVAASLGARAEAKGLRVEIAIARNLPERVSGDEVRLRSALENLVDNAVKFTERGVIRFSVSSAAAGRGRTRLTFSIKDSGIGIIAADLKRLFRPFTQANEEVARRYGGAGLGLVLVKRIAGAIGGSLDVTSKPGRGSTFTLRVIVTPDVAAIRRRSAVRGAMPALRVLCVEDNPFGRVVLGTVLRELGHQVSFAGGGEAAIEKLAREQFDLVMMDVTLPDIDGIETTRRIRALAGLAGRIPVIGVSGRTDPAHAAAAKSAGMNLYLHKPATPAEINEALRTVLVRPAESA